MSVDFDMSQVSALAAELANAAPKAAVVSSVLMTRIAAEMANDARAAVAVDTGETRASIRVESSEDSRVVIADSRAAFFLEFGTSDTAPQPFMWSQAPKASERLAQALEGINPFD